MPMKESGIRIIGTRITRYQQRNQRQDNNTLQYDLHAHSARKCLGMFHQLYDLIAVLNKAANEFCFKNSHAIF